MLTQELLTVPCAVEIRVEREWNSYGKVKIQKTIKASQTFEEKKIQSHTFVEVKARPSASKFVAEFPCYTMRLFHVPFVLLLMLTGQECILSFKDLLVCLVVSIFLFSFSGLVH